MIRKTTKKFLSLMLVAVFLVSMMPSVGMAETDIPLTMFDSTATRLTGGSSTNVGIPSSYYDAIRVKEDTDDIRYGYTKLNFSGYEEILHNKETSIQIYFKAGVTSSRSCKDFIVYAMPDGTENFSTKVTYNSAAEIGLHDFEKGIEIFRYSSDASGYGIEVNSAVDVDSIIKMLGTCTNDSILVLSLKAITTTDSYVVPQKLVINYNENDINNEEYVEDLAAKLTWDVLSSGQLQTDVTSDIILPQKWYGANVTWSASPAGVINTTTGELTPPASTTQVTLTPSLSYQSAIEGSEVATATGDAIILTLPVFNPRDYVQEMADKFTWADISEEQAQDAITESFTLPGTYEDVSIEWTSDKPAVISNTGTVVRTDKTTDVKLTAIFKYEYQDIVYSSEPKEINVKVARNITDLQVGYTGSENFTKGGGSADVLTTYTYVKESESLGNKLPGDAYYKFIDASGNPYIQLANGTALTGKKDVFEMSVLFTEDSAKYLKADIAVFNADSSQGYSASETSIAIVDDDIIVNNVTIAKMPLDEWVNIAMETPADENSRDCKYYVNGELKYTLHLDHTCLQKVTDDSTPMHGIRHARLMGNSPNESETPTAYIDNISVYSGEYNPLYDQVVKGVATDGFDSEGGTLTLTKAATVADIKALIEQSDMNSIRVYAADGAIAADTDSVTDGYKMVIASDRGTTLERAYSYYDIRMANGKVLFDAPAINVDSSNAIGNVKLFNYSGDSVEYKVYLVSYHNGELMEVNPVNIFANNNEIKSTDSTLKVSAVSGYTYKLFVWDGMTPKVVATEG